MSNRQPHDNKRAKAASLVTAAESKARSDGDRLISLIARETVTEAVTQDLSAASDSAEVDEQRIAKVEAQTRVLAEAVIAMSEPTERISDAVKAAKDEM
jgi:hypothetical protein